MLIGLPRELKAGEQRVGLTPHAVRELALHDHQVLVENGAGAGIRVSDAEYEAAGALIRSCSEVWDKAELVVKVKEPQASERKMLGAGQILFAYLHLAPDPDQTADLVDSGAACVAYETVTDSRGGLPLLAPMSRVAGRLAVQAGAWALETAHGGIGLLIGGVPGVPPARVAIIGGGVVGENAAEIAIGMGADVRVLDIDPAALDHLEQRFGASVVTVTSTRATVETEVQNADLVIGAVLVTGARAPKLVTADLIKQMRPGSVVVDVAIDQGGCFETSKPTTHARRRTGHLNPGAERRHTATGAGHRRERPRRSAHRSPPTSRPERLQRPRHRAPRSRRPRPPLHRPPHRPRLLTRTVTTGRREILYGQRAPMSPSCTAVTPPRQGVRSTKSRTGTRHQGCCLR